MFKARLGKYQREVLLELMKVISEVDGNVSHEEMELIYRVKKAYRMMKYEYKCYTPEQIRFRLEKVEEKDVMNILTHAILLALADGEFTKGEQNLIKSYFDMLSLESASKMQKFLDKYGKQEFNVKEFFYQDQSDQEILDESIQMMHDFASGSSEDIDEELLMKMRRGPVKKIWDQVLKLWDVVQNPKTDTAVKAIAIGALVYLISPLDVIPDVVPVLGLTDDVSVLAYAMAQLSKMMNKRG